MSNTTKCYKWMCCTYIQERLCIHWLFEMKLFIYVYVYLYIHIHDMELFAKWWKIWVLWNYLLNHEIKCESHEIVLNNQIHILQTLNKDICWK